MAKFDNRKFTDRAEASAKARQTLLAKFAARPKEDDPEVVRRKAEREAIIKAREIRVAEREAARVAKELAEREAREKAEYEAEMARIAAEEERKRREEELEAERKAARDARYAARKLRKVAGSRVGGRK